MLILHAEVSVAVYAQRHAPHRVLDVQGVQEPVALHVPMGVYLAQGHVQQPAVKTVVLVVAQVAVPDVV